MLGLRSIVRATSSRSAKPVRFRCRSVTSSPPDRLQSLLATHYSRGQPVEHAQDFAEQAEQELRWLSDAARVKSASQEGANWEERLEKMVKEIVEHDKPLAYVLGTQPFHPLPVELLVRSPTLIPRPETEHWVSLLYHQLLSSPAFDGVSSQPKKPFRILDIGTGSGCIALALTHALSTFPFPPRPVHTLAVDRSPSALQLATENARRCDLLHPSSPSSSGISLLETDLFSPAFASTVLSHLSTTSSSSSRFDLVVSNPPYIPLHEYAQVEASVREWEDRGALVGELSVEGSGSDEAASSSSGADDGLVFYRRITSLLDKLLAAPSADSKGAPVVAFEVGKGQARAVERLLVARGFKAEVIEDHAGVERAVFGFR